MDSFFSRRLWIQMVLSGPLKAKTHLCITEAVMGVEGRLQEGGQCTDHHWRGSAHKPINYHLEKTPSENWVKFGDEGAPLRAVVVV